MKFQYKFNEVIKNPYITTVLLTSHQYFSFVSLSSLSILLLLPMTFPLWWYILIRTLKKTDGHHVFRKAAEAVYSEIIDNHWLRTMAASSKDGLYIGETYVTVIHSVTLASAASSDNHKSRGVLNTSHQVQGVLSTHVTSPMVDNTDEHRFIFGLAHQSLCYISHI